MQAIIRCITDDTCILEAPVECLADTFLMWVWPCIVVNMWETEGQLDATDWFLLQNLLSAQHVSGTIMPIIRSSRVIQMVGACGNWLFGFAGHWSGVWGTGCCLSNIPQPGYITYSYQGPAKPKRRVPQAATICITLELLMMSIMMPETCCANSKFCNENQSVASSWPSIFHRYFLIYTAWKTHMKTKMEINCLQALMLLGDYVCIFFCFALNLTITSPQYVLLVSCYVVRFTYCFPG